MKPELAPAIVPGIRFAGVSAGIKSAVGALDLGLIVADRPSAAAAVFTENRIKAAPVRIAAERIKAGRLQAILANSGCANSFTGRPGMQLARESCVHVARLIGCSPALVAPCSTGVIGHLYDLGKFKAGAEAAAQSLGADRMGDFARAIMTTDTRPKVASTRIHAGGATITIAGACKGVGMIAPHMATMLAFIATDAAVSPAVLKRSLKSALPHSFNAITVDSDMSTNDTAIIMASGAADNSKFGVRDQAAFDRAVGEVATALARELVSDGEGATKLVTVDVRGARSAADAERVARAIADSPLVKTAFFGADPNVGRIMMAAGKSGANVDPDRLVLSIG
ncbi:MAG TPA: bifunctional glutamate N-acetyltransferase/amino-acid acetyltransferase ArgJ, partial [Candidatus Binataceae bacterium]|nr:bifunctional glutamate N-acetyltransferase/amino-acid acetyltransferase ArgJ [Candidatus Binataceae bacterium]